MLIESADIFKLVNRLLSLLDNDMKTVTLPIGVVKEAIDGLPIHEARAMLTIAKGMHEVASALRFVQREVKTTSACLVGNVFRDDIGLAL